MRVSLASAGLYPAEPWPLDAPPIYEHSADPVIFLLKIKVFPLPSQDLPGSLPRPPVTAFPALSLAPTFLGVQGEDPAESWPCAPRGKPPCGAFCEPKGLQTRAAYPRQPPTPPRDLLTSSAVCRAPAPRAPVEVPDSPEPLGTIPSTGCCATLGAILAPFLQACAEQRQRELTPAADRGLRLLSARIAADPLASSGARPASPPRDRAGPSTALLPSGHALAARNSFPHSHAQCPSAGVSPLQRVGLTLTASELSDFET